MLEVILNAYKHIFIMCTLYKQSVQRICCSIYLRGTRNWHSRSVIPVVYIKTTI